jgi:thiamine biosynthesis lipoprotein
MTVFHRSELRAQGALAAAFAELELIEELMSLYRPSSQLSRLNHHRVLSDPHPMLLDVLACAQHTSEVTKGAFDITIQPLWELYAAAQQSGRLPCEAQVEAARRLVDWRRVEIGRGQVRLRGKGTKITLNGIAQGYAADRVIQTLRGHGIQNALIDTGEIGALGLKPPGNAWTIGIQHPRDEQAYVSLVKLSGRCLATSGDYATTFSPDHQHHHLFDPRTGHSPTELSSVSIAAQTAMQADALSTAVFVIGMEAGAKLIGTTPGAEGMLIAKDGRTLVTAGFAVA